MGIKIATKSNVEWEQTFSAIVSAKKIFGQECNYPMLLVEGKDDIEVINNYYWFKKTPSKIPFMLVTGEGFYGTVGGKKTALKAYKEYKEVFSEHGLVCLLDRDFDFILGENENNSDIYYYPYYELENFILDEKILKVILKKFYDCYEIEEFSSLKNDFFESKNIFKYYIYFNIMRELHYNSPEIFNEKNIEYNIEEVNTFINVPFQKIEGVMQGKQKYKDVHFSICYDAYMIEAQAEILKKYNSIIEYIKNEYLQDEILKDEKNPFLFLIDGKKIVNSIEFILKRYLKKENVRQINIGDVKRDLINEWIPNYSDEFADLIDEISKKFV